MQSVCSLLLLLIVLFAQCTNAYSKQDLDGMQKREVQPEWEDLGWAWGKRSAPTFSRLLRAVRPVKKNPDWHDLGWTWGRRK